MSKTGGSAGPRASPEMKNALPSRKSKAGLSNNSSSLYRLSYPSLQFGKFISRAWQWKLTAMSWILPTIAAQLKQRPLVRASGILTIITEEILIGIVLPFLVVILEDADKISVPSEGSHLANISFTRLFHVWLPLTSEAWLVRWLIDFEWLKKFLKNEGFLLFN